MTARDDDREHEHAVRSALTEAVTQAIEKQINPEDWGWGPSLPENAIVAVLDTLAGYWAGSAGEEQLRRYSALVKESIADWNCRHAASQVAYWLPAAAALVFAVARDGGAGRDKVIPVCARDSDGRLVWRNTGPGYSGPRHRRIGDPPVFTAHALDCIAGPIKVARDVRPGRFRTVRDNVMPSADLFVLPVPYLAG